MNWTGKKMGRLKGVAKAKIKIQCALATGNGGAGAFPCTAGGRDCMGSAQNNWHYITLYQTNERRTMDDERKETCGRYQANQHKPKHKRRMIADCPSMIVGRLSRCPGDLMQIAGPI